MARKRTKIVPMKYPVGQEYGYRKILLRLTHEYKIVLKKNMSPYVAAMATEATAVHLPTGNIRQDAGWRDQLASVMARITRDMTKHTNKAIKDMLKVAPQINQYNKDEWKRLIRSQYGVDPTKEDPQRFDALMKNWATNNSLLIKDIPHKTSMQIAEQTTKALTEGTSLPDTQKAIYDIMIERTDVSDSRAKLIARDQVAKLNGSLTQERQQDIGVDSYVWRTVGDERVRDTHAEVDGETFSWDSPPSETDGNHPGEDYQCRCWAEPVLPEFLAFEASLLDEAA
jgi:SPP1 gp7 family putative phage head morphogenesis protein